MPNTSGPYLHAANDPSVAAPLPPVTQGRAEQILKVLAPFLDTGDSRSSPDWAVEIYRILAAEPEVPHVHAVFEVVDGDITGTQPVTVKRVEPLDDGGLAVVLDYWPEPQNSAGGAAAALTYFAANPAEGEFNTHDTLAAARADADDMLDTQGEEGWMDEPPQICYGLVLAECVEVAGSRRPAPEGSEFTEVVEFELVPVALPAGHPAGIADQIDALCDAVEALDADPLACVPDAASLPGQVIAAARRVAADADALKTGVAHG